MALGFSGSNGGIVDNNRTIGSDHIINPSYDNIEVSYFVNNSCNLSCKHCYVGYSDKSIQLSLKEWIYCVEQCIEMGALTFGNVGKEPLFTWESTFTLLAYLQKRKVDNRRLRYGLVTNGVLLDIDIAASLADTDADYIDISIDGDHHHHNLIRGNGVYEKLLGNIPLLSHVGIIDRVFASFTANRINLSNIGAGIIGANKMGISNFLISPYVTLSDNDPLYISDNDFVTEIERLLEGEIIDFRNSDNLCIYVKTDFSSSLAIMNKLVEKNFIDKNNLFVDEYGVIFSKYVFGTNRVYFNYLPWDNSFTQAIRISHDGYVSNCLDMFYEDYPIRAVGNVREKPIKEIIETQRKLIAEKQEIAGCC